MKIRVGARKSPLSRAQFEEVEREIRLHFPSLVFDPVWVDTMGDLDQKTSLRGLEKTDFFTKELDEMLFKNEIQIAIHSAKDLPHPLCSGIEIVALTRGVDPRDSLVMREGESLETLRKSAIVATSSIRREEMARRLRSDFTFIDLRGTIDERLKKLWNREADAVIVAEAAIIRLKLDHLNRVFLPGKAAENQGRLAIAARKEDVEMKTIFQHIHFGL